MTVADQILKSLGGTFKAFGLLSKSKLNWVYIFPFAIYGIIFLVGFSITDQIHNELMSYLKNLTSNQIDDNGFFGFLFSASSVLTWIIIKLSVFILLGILSGYVTLIILSPVYAWISEKIEEEITGVSYPFNFSKFIKDIVRAIIIAVRNGIIQIAFTVVLFILSFVPGVNLFTAPLLFIITAYFYGFSFLDYTHERIGLTMGGSIKEVRKLKFAATSLGSLFLLCYMIPWIGPFIACMTSFQLIVAGTTLVLENNSIKSKKSMSPQEIREINPDSSNQESIK